MKRPLLLAGLALFSPLAYGTPPPGGWLAVTNAVREQVFIIPRSGPSHPGGQMSYVLEAEMETTEGSVYLKLGDGPSWVIAFTGGSLLTAGTGSFPNDAAGFQNGQAVVNARFFPGTRDRLRVEVEGVVNGVKQPKTLHIVPLAQADGDEITTLSAHLSGTARIRATLTTRRVGALFLIK